MLELGSLGQIPQLATYSLLTLGFPINDSDQDEVVSLLEKAADEMTQSYPWIAGQVIHEKSEDEKEPNSGIYKVVSFKAHEQPSSFVHVKDCKDLCPSYADLIQSRAPLSMLDGNIICPTQGFPYPYPSNVTMPVVFVQANFVRGGLLLTSSGHHMTMDGNGHEQFVMQLARLCRGEKLLEEHVRFGNADQNRIFPPLDEGQVPSLMGMTWSRCPSKLNDAAGEWPPQGLGETWRLFKITAGKIAALKAEASKECSPDSDVQYISSNDAVTTFIWTRLVSVRSGSLPKGNQSSLIRCVNGRKRLSPPISEGYMGHSILCSHTTLPFTSILHDTPSATCLKVRKSLMEVDDHEVRSFFNMVQAEKDKTTIQYGAKYDPATDLFITSFVAQKIYSASFGLLGIPDFVRRPRLADGVGFCYLLPLTREGDIDIEIGLSDDEYEGLKADAKWTDFFDVIE